VQKLFRLFYKKPSLGPKNIGKGKKRVSILNLKVGCGIKNKKTHVKTKFNNKVIMFEKTLEFKNGIIICYG
jgi:hypothetical protein